MYVFKVNYRPVIDPNRVLQNCQTNDTHTSGKMYIILSSNNVSLNINASRVTKNRTDGKADIIQVVAVRFLPSLSNYFLFALVFGTSRTYTTIK